MTSEIFLNELRQWDNELRCKNRKILLLVDNCPAHPDVKDLESIKLVFMPPNTSSRLQPMDQGVIHSLKSNYRHLLLMKMINSIDKKEENFTVNLLDAINLIHMAWQKVTQKTILNCFRHGGFIRSVDNFDLEDNIPLVDWLRLNHDEDIGSQNALTTAIDSDAFEEYVHFDDNLITVELLDDDAIVASVSGSEDVDENEDDEESENVEFVAAPVSTSDALCFAGGLRAFLQSKNTPQRIFNGLADVELFLNDLKFSQTKQSKIHDFFK